MDDPFAYRPGLIFLAPDYPGLRIPIKDVAYYPPLPDGTREVKRPPITAEFAADDSLFGREVATVEGHTSAEVRGGCFVLDMAVEQNGWDEEERDAVARKLLKLAADPTFHYMRLWEPPVPVSPLPNYERLSPARVLALAAELGVVNEALVYERATLNREELVGQLERKWEAQLERERADEALTAA